MRLSPEAVLLGLELLSRKAVSADDLARRLREAAERGGSAQLAVLQEGLLATDRNLEPVLDAAAARAVYDVLTCQACRRTFRVRPDQARPGLCPLCGESMAAPVSLLEWRAAPHGLRAAEGPSPAYEAAPRRFAHFEVLELVGRGGAGRVFKARNVRTDRTVALKLLDFQPLESVAETFRRLGRESRVAAAVAHENIVRILDLGIAEGVPFIEMEFVEGLSLRRHVQRHGPMQAGAACRVVGQALAGLEQVHRAQIVHGDVKPGNILIDSTGRARLTDFGVAKFLEETTSLRALGRAVGSPHFMAPEQWTGALVSPRTDVYAMGLVLYYALTGRLPYEGATGPALMYRHLHEPLVGVGEQAGLVPLHLARVIERAASKDGQGRYASADEFRRALAPEGR